MNYLGTSLEVRGARKSTRARFLHVLEPRTSNLKAGFTLIELLVVCAIIVMVAGLVLANQGKFGGQVLLQNFAYDVALSLRQAQVYGISVQRFGAASDRRFNAGYGIYIDHSPPYTQYILFADSHPLTPNHRYRERSDPDDPTTGDEVRTRMDIKRGYTISKLCVPATPNAADCYPANALHIIFLRPEPDAFITWTNSGSSPSTYICTPAALNDSNPNTCPSSARIVLKSPRGETMSVVVYNNGQIAVDQSITN